MDAAKSKRMFPSYTTAQLEQFLVQTDSPCPLTPERRAMMEKEVADRKAGISVHRPTPVSHGGIVIPRIGRM